VTGNKGPLKLPDNTTITVLTQAQAQAVADRIISRKPAYIAVDCEWPYTEAAGPQRVCLLQIAVPGDHEIYLIHFPIEGVKTQPTITSSLKTLLEDSGIAKVGLNISTDAAKLKRDLGVTTANTVDLQHVAHDKGLIHVRRVQLKSLCSLVLKAQLPKDSAVRCSSWGKKKLTANQQEYAALDVYATLSIYEALGRIDTGFDSALLGTFDVGQWCLGLWGARCARWWWCGALKCCGCVGMMVLFLLADANDVKEGMRVVLVTKTGKLQAIASGEVVAGPHKKTLWRTAKDGRRLFRTPNHAIIRLDEAPPKIPGAYLPYPTDDFTTVGALASAVRGGVGDGEESKDGDQGGPPPSPEILWDIKYLRRPSRTAAGVREGGGGAKARDEGGGGDGSGRGGGADGDADDSEEHAGEELDDSWEKGVEEVDIPLRDLMADEDVVVVNPLPDWERAADGDGCDGDVDDDEVGPEECNADHGRHVKLDVLHAMNRIMRTLRKRHGAFHPFCRRLMDAMWVVVPADVERVKQKKIAAGMDEEKWKEYLATHWGEVRKKCRRMVPSPKVLVRRLKQLEEVYANIKDSETGLPFFSKKTWKRWKSLMKHAEKGCLSDPDPSRVVLYYVVGHAKDGSDILSCSRGTSDLEVSSLTLLAPQKQ
jgi:hypothetical protein